MQKWEYATLTLYPGSAAKDGQPEVASQISITEGRSEPRSYKPASDGQLRKHLSEMGTAGWEAFSFTVLYPTAHMVYVFKRPLP